MIQSGSTESERTEGISATGRKRACDSCFKRKVNQPPQLHILQLLHLPLVCGVFHPLTSICPSPSVSAQSNVSLTLIGKQIQCLRPDPAVPCSWCDHRGVSCTLTRVSKYQKTKKTSLLVYPVLSHAPTITLDESYLTACPFRDSFSSAKSITKESFSRRLQKIEDTLARTLAYQKTNTEVTTCSPTPVDTPPLPVPIPEVEEREQSSNFAIPEETDSIHKSIPIRNSPFNNTAWSGLVHYSGCHFGHISSHNGMLALSDHGQQWISKRTGEYVSFSRFQLTVPRTLPPPLSAKNFYSSDELYELPEQSITQQLSHILFKSGFILMFPVLDRLLFEETVILAYEPCHNPSCLAHTSAKACVLSFLSISYLFKGRTENLPNVESDKCAAKANHLLSDVFEHSSIETLQTVFMLYMHQAFSGQLQSAAALHAIACRILRMIFWLCYIFDKDIALRSGQPPLISDDFCDLTFPYEYKDHYSSQPALAEGVSLEFNHCEEPALCLPGDLGLSRLKERTSRLLYSVQAQRKTDAEILRNIRELDDDLENWRLSVPPNFRPALSIPDGTQILLQDMKLHWSIRYVILHLEYYHLMSTIHGAGERYSILPTEIGSDDSNQNPGIQSSIALSLEASRSTVTFLRTAVSGLSGEAFW
ncbi:hypothetical protein EDB80DRAFT_880059 [Ilyonectria destructans]|nr:hypothetical protein EDB80DRAFT_880059 [Ilyonectria destructans]